jgi:hypothetical protein
MNDTLGLIFFWLLAIGFVAATVALVLQLRQSRFFVFYCSLIFLSDGAIRMTVSPRQPVSGAACIVAALGCVLWGRHLNRSRARPSN